MGFFKELGHAVKEATKESMNGQPYYTRCENCGKMTRHYTFYKDGKRAVKCDRCGAVWVYYD